jgi:SPOR domain/Bacterial type II and III secretion system protein
MTKFFLIVVVLIAALNTFAQQVAIELKVVEMERIDWTERRTKLTAAKSIHSINRASFAAHLPKPVARSLENTVSKRVHSVRFTAPDRKSTQIQFAARAPEGMTRADATLFFELTPKIFPHREMALDMKANMEIQTDGSSFKTQPVRHLIRIAEGESIILGGFVNDDEARFLSGMPMLKDNPLLHYLFSEKRGQPDEPEIVLVLNPNIEGSPPNITLDVHALSMGRSLYTVQVGAFEKPDSATSLVGRLEKQYDDVFIERFARDRTFYRVRVGCLTHRGAVKQLEQQLRAEGFQPFIAQLGREGCRGTARGKS